MADSRPNILLITTDQQSATAMSCAGNPYVRTPVLDALAARGVRFNRAYASNPICVASRTSYWTGTASHENGVATNLHSGQAPVDVPCLASVFRQHGYDTAHIGKWHVPRVIDDTPWSGFNHIDVRRDNGADDLLPDAAVKWLGLSRDKPFFAAVEFVNPHDICEWGRRLAGLQDKLPNGEIGVPPPADQCPPLPANHAIPEGEPPEIRIHQHDPGMARAYCTHDWLANDPRWRQYLWGYYRIVEKVDANIGRLLEGLRQLGLEENTVVVFTSDHGDGGAAHRLNQKTLFYDQMARVPLIVSWPGRTAAGASDASHLVNIGTDLMVTLMDFAGIEKPGYLPGISAVGEEAHEFIVCENNHHHSFGSPGEVNGRMVRSGRYKYVCYDRGEPFEQLFDMEADPGELTDLTLRDDAEARGALEAHRRMLERYIRETGDVFRGGAS